MRDRSTGSLICVALSVCLLGGTSRCLANELVCLKSGFCLQALSHAAENGRVALQMGTGSVELAASEIASVEQLKATDPAPTLKQVPAPPPKPLIDPKLLLSQAADTEGLDADFVRSVAQIESGLQSAALSRKGAYGLMQLMPGTAKDLAVDSSQPSENALGGAKYLRTLLLKYHNNSALALAAYNAGPGAVEKYRGVPPYSETQQYVRRVTHEYDRLHAASLAKTKKSTVQVAATSKSAARTAVAKSAPKPAKALSKPSATE